RRGGRPARVPPGRAAGDEPPGAALPGVQSRSPQHTHPCPRRQTGGGESDTGHMAGPLIPERSSEEPRGGRAGRAPTSARWRPTWSSTPSALRPVVKTLGEHGIRFGIEFVGAPSLRAPYSYEFVHDLPVALDLGVRTAEPNVVPLMDTWHLHTSAGTLD